MCHDSVVVIATRYWPERPRIKSWWGWDFLHPSRSALGATQPPIQWVSRLSQGLSVRGLELTTHPTQRRGYRSSAIHLLPLSAFVSWSRANFTVRYIIASLKSFTLSLGNNFCTLHIPRTSPTVCRLPGVIRATSPSI